MSTFTHIKTFAALPHAERGRPVRLNGDPKGQNIVYCHGNSVFIRNLQDPSQVDIYTEHAKQTTVAKYSPSRFYIASADIAGKVRIWDTVNPEHILKKEFPVIGGAICDLDWSPDSQNLVVGGIGSEKFGSVIDMSTGTTKGNIDGQSKSINTVGYRPVGRGNRIVTASEDHSVAFFKGPPFAFVRTQKKHNGFANVARFSPDGQIILSGGADGKLYKFDGEQMEESELKELGSPAHKGGIYGLCFNGDGTQVLTAGGDKTAKVFDVQTGSVLQEFAMGKEWQDMQLGCLWMGSELLTVNGRGHITYLSQETPDQAKRIIKGHMKPITAMAVSEDGKYVFTGSLEGIVWWDVDTSLNDTVSGPGHTNQVTDMAIEGDTLVSVGVDDTVRFASVSAAKFMDQSVKLDSQPKAVALKNGVCVVAGFKHLTVLNGKSKKSAMEIPFEAVSVSIHMGGVTVAVGCNDKKIRVYQLEGHTLAESRQVELPEEVDVVSYSPEGVHLAVAMNRTVLTLSTTDYRQLGESKAHTARVRCIAWSPNSTMYATGGLDSCVRLMDDFDKSFKSRPFIKAHTMSHANKLAWLNERTIVTAGQDSNVKFFSLVDDPSQTEQNVKRF